jgi:predicted MFS family arabinose efflux permease
VSSAAAPSGASTRTLVAALALGTLGAAALVMLPGLVAAVGAAFGLDTSQLGYFSSAELGGLTAGSVVGALISRRLGLRLATALGLITALLASLGSLFVNGFGSLLLVRAVAGLGSGVLVSIAYIIIGRSHHVTRNFSFYLISQGMLGAVALVALPTLNEAFGGRAIFGVLAVTFALALAFLSSLPKAFAAPSDQPRASGQVAGWIGIGALLLFFAAQGAIWSYLESIGTRSGHTGQAVASSIALSSLVGLSGPLLAAILGNRVGNVIPIIGGSVLSVAALGAFGVRLDLVAFALAACTFNFAWNFVIPFQLEIIAAADADGGVIGWAAPASFGGLALGPALAGLLLETSGLTSIMVLSGVLLLVSAAALVGIARGMSTRY